MTDLHDSAADPLAVRVGALELRSPLIAASGACAFGQELDACGTTRYLGALVTKTVTLEPREGNPPPRICETTAGLINSIGLANPGYDAFAGRILPCLPLLACPHIINIGARNEKEFAELAARMARDATPAALELNLSCPNVTGGLDLSRSPEALGSVTRVVRDRWPGHLWVKLTPNVAEIRPLVEAAALAGADAVVVANTYLGMAIDWRTHRSRIARPMGGLSGPAIKPLALRLAYQAASVGALPVVASGGVLRAEDVLEFVVAGAAAVEVGSLLLRDPFGPRAIDGDLRRLLAQEGIASLAALRGAFTP